MASLSVRRAAAVAALLTASVGAAFSQESQNAKGPAQPSVPASAPPDPAVNLSNEDVLILPTNVDAVLHEKPLTEYDLKGADLPRVPKTDRNLLAVTLGDFNREDFDTKVYRDISGDTESDIVVTYRLTSIRTKPDAQDTVRASPAYVDYRLPLFEAVRFEDDLREKRFVIMEGSDNSDPKSDATVKKSQQQDNAEQKAAQEKIIEYVAAALLVTAGGLALWVVNSGLSICRWLTKQKRETPMAEPLPTSDPSKVAPGDSFQFTIQPGAAAPILQLTGNSSSRLQYSIKGGSQPIVSVSLKPGEAIVAETGSLLLKDSSISMKRVSGRDEGYAPDSFGFVKRWFMGESFWFLKYRNEAQQTEELILSPSKVGTMLSLKLGEYPNGLVADGGSFFAAGRGVKLTTNRVLSIGDLFSGLGPFQQRMTGNGEVFLFSSGEVRELYVERGKQLLLDPDAVFAWEPTVSVKAKWLGLWSGIVSGEGFFLCSASGEGRLFYSSRGVRDDPAKDRTGGPTGVVAKYLDKFI